MRLKHRGFLGEVPAISPAYLEDQNAQVSTNVDFEQASLRPLRGLLGVRDTALDATPEALFKYDDETWYEWAEDTDVVRAVAANDQYERTHFSNSSGLRVTTKTKATASAPYPDSSYQLGVPLPATRPTVSAASGSDELRYYVYTCVNIWGEESPPSQTSSGITINNGATVTVGGLNHNDGDFAPVDHYNIYRTLDGSFFYVGSTTGTPSSFTDDFELVQEQLPSEEWDSPPTDLRGLTFISDGVLMAFRGNEVRACEPGLPHAWPVRYKFPTEHNVVDIRPIEGGAVVLTEGEPYLLLGQTPGAMGMVPLRQPYRCLAKRGVAKVQGIVVFPTPRGLVGVTNAGAQLLTAGVFDKDDWDALNAVTFRAFNYRNWYVAAYTDKGGAHKGFMFDPTQPQAGITRFTGINVRGRYRDPSTGDVFVAIGDKVYQWNASEKSRYFWKSKRHDFVRPGRIKVAEVLAEDYPVTLTVYRDGQSQARVSIGSKEPVRVPNPALGRTYELSVESDKEVYDITVATTMDELRQT